MTFLARILLKLTKEQVFCILAVTLLMEGFLWCVYDPNPPSPRALAAHFDGLTLTTNDGAVIQWLPHHHP